MDRMEIKVSDRIFIDKNTVQREKYACPMCGYLLRDAVQTSCGHWLCKTCAQCDLFAKQSNPTCPRVDCGEVLEIEDGKEYFPDKFVRKEIGKFAVRCFYYTNNCPWTGTLKNLSDHMETCKFQQQQCIYCQEHFDKDKITIHERNCPKALINCPFVEYGCEFTEEMTRVDCDKHLEAAVASHSILLAIAMKKFTKLKENYEEKQVVSAFRGQMGTVEKQIRVEDNQMHYLQQRVEATIRENGDKHSGQVVVNSQHSWKKSFITSEEIDKGQPSYSTASGGGDIEYLKKQIASKDSQIRHLQDKLQQVEATILAKTTENEDRDFRLSLMENSNYNGTMLWKVPQFTQRMDDARSGKYTSIFSLPFYSGRHGYKMCLRLYILGDGIGKGSHMSLFIVLMKGEFDNMLQWPFNHKVTFKLINKCGGRNVVDVFQPDPLSSSFQKPKTDMNIASGCPQFVSLNELMQNGFVMDDTIFITVNVNTM